MTEIERLFLAAYGFNTNLVDFLPPYNVIISNVRICSFTGLISPTLAQTCTCFACTKFCIQKIIIYEVLI